MYKQLVYLLPIQTVIKTKKAFHNIFAKLVAKKDTFVFISIVYSLWFQSIQHVCVCVCVCSSNTLLSYNENFWWCAESGVFVLPEGLETVYNHGTRE